jgi:hypothetical protein
MDSESLPSKKFDLSPSTWIIDRIILVSDKDAAESFLAHVYPHSSHCLVASADQAYPHDERLRRLVFTSLRENPQVRVVAFSLAAVRQVGVLTERLLILEDLVMQDFKRRPWEKNIRFELDSEKIAFLVETFFRQWEKVLRVANPAFAYRNFKEYRQEDFDWRARLVIPDTF